MPTPEGQPSQLKFYASLWTLSGYPDFNEAAEWTPKQKFTAIRAAGFEGYQWFAVPEIVRLGNEHGLAYLGCCQATAENHLEALRAFAKLSPLRVSVQLGHDTTQPEEAARVWLEMLKHAEDLNFAVDLETHRGTCTETPEKTWQIADIVAQKTGKLIELNFDFSHFAVVKHLQPPYGERLLVRPGLLQASRQIHLRPFNGHHCQIPITDSNDQITDWAEHWFQFAAEVLESWQEANNTVTLWACPEFGSLQSGYWISPFADPWQDTQRCRQRLSLIWSKLVQAYI